MKELAGGGGSCPICLDGLENGEGTVMTSCGHAFHKDCIEESLKSRGQCPNCRQQVLEVCSTTPPTPVDPYLKYGTKVKVMIQQLKDIMRDYPGDRLLLFVQYKDMRKKLEQAFREFEVPFLTLSGSARTQGNAITRWQSGQDPDDFLMMLSCEEHNSGITLTRARPGACFRVLGFGRV
jgi:SWI/SNF-related matrix-associated actin-dependent regulator of chromatin subfamily A3